MNSIKAGVKIGLPVPDCRHNTQLPVTPDGMVYCTDLCHLYGKKDQAQPGYCEGCRIAGLCVSRTQGAEA